MKALIAGTDPQIIATFISRPDHRAMSTPVTKVKEDPLTRANEWTRICHVRLTRLLIDGLAHTIVQRLEANDRNDCSSVLCVRSRHGNSQKCGLRQSTGEDRDKYNTLLLGNLKRQDKWGGYNKEDDVVEDIEPGESIYQGAPVCTSSWDEIVPGLRNWVTVEQRSCQRHYAT